MLVVPILRAQALERKMVAGMAGLVEVHHPYMLDTADLLKPSWKSVTGRIIARY